MIAVVKAGGYGHGARIVSAALVGGGVDALAVATVAEAAELRAGGIDLPLLLLQGIHAPDEADFAHEQRLTCAVGRMEALAPLEAAAERAGRPFPVHLKFDTGMTRLGFQPETIDALLDRVLGNPQLDVQGLMSHLACADDADSAQTPRQRASFGALVARARERGLDPEWIHLDNSPGVLHGPTEVSTAIRPGLALYGADPTLEGGADLAPVMSLCTHVAQVQEVAAGRSVGYGAVYTTERATRIAVLPLGYADGLPRAAAPGGWTVALRGRTVPIVGSVSMDLCAIDAGPDQPVAVGDEVLVFGRRHGMELRIEERAERCGTIAYEILTGIGPRVPRVAVRRAAPSPG